MSKVLKSSNTVARNCFHIPPMAASGAEGNVHGFANHPKFATAARRIQNIDGQYRLADLAANFRRNIKYGALLECSQECTST